MPIVKFELMRLLSTEERKEREELDRVREEVDRNCRPNIVTAQDIVETVAARANVTPEAVRNAMRMKERGADRTRTGVATCTAAGATWPKRMVTHLAGCSAEDAEQLCDAIRGAKGAPPSGGLEWTDGRT